MRSLMLALDSLLTGRPASGGWGRVVVPIARTGPRTTRPKTPRIAPGQRTAAWLCCLAAPPVAFLQAWATVALPADADGLRAMARSLLVWPAPFAFAALAGAAAACLLTLAVLTTGFQRATPVQGRVLAGALGAAAAGAAPLIVAVLTVAAVVLVVVLVLVSTVLLLATLAR